MLDEATRGSRCFEVLFTDICGQLLGLSSPSLKRQFAQTLRITPLSKSQKYWQKRQHEILEEPLKMNARPHIREKLIEVKLRRWCRIALDPKYYPGYTATQARRNFWRLCKAHPDVMRRIGYSELSVYQ